MTRGIVATALVVFLLAGFGGWFLSRSSATDSVGQTTTTMTVTTTEPPVAYFNSPYETLIGPAAVVATDLRLDGDEIILEFTVDELQPVGDAASVTRFFGFGLVEEVPAEELGIVYLDAWTLETAGDAIPGSVATPAARTVRFDVGENFSEDAVTGVRLESYGLLVPVDTEFTLDLDSDTATVAPGIDARLLAVTEQARTIIQVELISEREFNYDNLAVAGVGPGWKSAVREAEGRPRWNLTYDFSEAPSPIPIRVYGAAWTTIESGVEIPLEGGGR